MLGEFCHLFRKSPFTNLTKTNIRTLEQMQIKIENQTIENLAEMQRVNN